MDAVSWEHAAAFAGGVAAFLSPCFFPLLPIYLSYLAGVEHQKRWRTFAHALLFVLGFSVLFSLYGVSIGLLGNFLEPHLEAIRILSASFLVVFGLMLVEAWRFIPKLSGLFRERSFAIPEPWRVRPNAWTSLAMGVVFAFAWTPCVGPILGSIMALALNFGSAQESTLLFAFYSAGLAVPFLAVAVAADVLRSRLYGWLARITPYIQIVSGLALIVIGALLLTNTLQYLFTFTY